MTHVTSPRRLRRLRKNASMRALFRENTLCLSDIVYPVFVMEGKNRATPVKSMPKCYRYSIDMLMPVIEKLYVKGIKGFALFPYIEGEQKDSIGSQVLNPDNLMNRTIRAVKTALPECIVFADVALDPYTIHGHDGIIDDAGYILNDETVEILAKQAALQAQAGADVICPSDMMDGRVKSIRHTLDTCGAKNTAIMSYAVKYASNFYGPFRDAVGSAQLLKGDKKTYQMQFANAEEAIREVEIDIEEGADMIMIKPGMPYLDILAHVKKTFMMPTLAYQVSGEYSMLRAMVDSKSMSENAIMESIVAFKRAGADVVFTYFAPDLVPLLS